MQEMYTDEVVQRRWFRRARWTGVLVFMGGAGLQMLAYLMVGMSILYYRHVQAHRLLYSSQRSFGEFLHEQNLMEGLTACFSSGVVYILVAGFMGMWAGKQVLRQRLRYGWVGLLSMLLPALAAAFGCVLYVSVVQGKGFPKEREFPEIILVFTGVFYGPGSVMGVLCGLLLRQIGRVREDKRLHQAQWDATAVA